MWPNPQFPATWSYLQKKSLMGNFLFCAVHWITSKTKGLVQNKNFAKNGYLQNNKDIQLFWRFRNIQKVLTATTEKLKEQYYIWILTKLMDPTTSPKAYWSILKTGLDNKKYLLSLKFIIITIILILKRRLRSSTSSLLSSAH